MGVQYPLKKGGNFNMEYFHSFSVIFNKEVHALEEILSQF